MPKLEKNKKIKKAHLMMRFFMLKYLFNFLRLLRLQQSLKFH